MKIQPLTEIVKLSSRLGEIGTIQAYDCWDARLSHDHAKEYVANVASLSYGNDEAKNPPKLFSDIVRRGHLSCLEFVPFAPKNNQHLPAASLRHNIDWLDRAITDADLQQLAIDRAQYPCHAFLIEMPLYLRSQAIRHRAASYLEMSRRYTLGSKVNWTYYGDSYFYHDEHGNEVHADPDRLLFWKGCEAEYIRRLKNKEPNEIASRCMPVEARTRFWCAAFDMHWQWFVDLRSDAHAQVEIQVYSNWIKNFLELA